MEAGGGRSPGMPSAAARRQRSHPRPLPSVPTLFLRVKAALTAQPRPAPPTRSPAHLPGRGAHSLTKLPPGRCGSPGRGASGAGYLKKRPGHRRPTRPTASPRRRRRSCHRRRLLRCAERWSPGDLEPPPPALPALRCARCARALLPGDRHGQAEPRPVRARRAADPQGRAAAPIGCGSRWPRPCSPRSSHAGGARCWRPGDWRPLQGRRGRVRSALGEASCGHQRARPTLLGAAVLPLLASLEINRRPERKEKEKTSLELCAGRTVAAAAVVSDS
ncbi:uncharacterized protein [Macaca fascicularis]|uniref:uncharacterized protein n=1 Tax=Macaca fascicularis TaxID=9541 RepID=UPI003D155DC9